MKKDPKIIVALDDPDHDALQKLTQRLSPDLCRLKVGNILFTRYGPAFIEALMQQGFDVFLDLKYHDIPQTVASACQQAATLGVWMMNLHVMAGGAALLAARERVDRCSQKPWLIGVTVLTSLAQADFSEFDWPLDVSRLVLQLALLAKRCGLDGVVCSAQEVALLRSQLGSDFLLVTPGIRLPGDDPGDQKRTMTPQEAFQAGASYLVVGRPITKAPDPERALRRFLGIN